jgi:hypothetical protein
MRGNTFLSSPLLNIRVSGLSCEMKGFQISLFLYILDLAWGGRRQQIPEMPSRHLSYYLDIK